MREINTGEKGMIYFKVFIFMFFAMALYGSIDCLIDNERALEHIGAWFSVCICVLGCYVAMITPK